MQDPNWNKIWSLKTWTKIHTFLWILRHKKILKWDNIMKRSVKGPSQCVMCYKQEETIHHLFYLYPLANLLCDNVLIFCGISQRIWGNIVNTLDIWTNHSFQNPTVNLVSKLIHGFLLWQISRERNNHIFNTHSRPPDLIWNTFQHHLLENISPHPCTKNDFIYGIAKAIISKGLDCNQNLLNTKCIWILLSSYSPDTWIHPQQASSNVILMGPLRIIPT